MRRAPPPTLMSWQSIEHRQAPGVVARDAGRSGVRTVPRAGIRGDLDRRHHHAARASAARASSTTSRRSPTSCGRASTSASETSRPVSTARRGRMRPPASAPPRCRCREDFAPDSLALALVNAAAMGLDDELEREASFRRSRIARAVADRLRARPAPSASTPRSPARRGPARCSPPWTRGRTTARGARRSARFVSRAPMRPLAATAVAARRRGASAAGRRAGARLRRDARVLSRRRRDAAGRGVRGRGRCARGDPRCRTGDARTREPRPGRVHRRRRDRRRRERPHPDRPRGRRHGRGRSIASPTRVPRSRHPLESRRGGRSTPACGAPAGLQLTLFQELGPA